MTDPVPIDWIHVADYWDEPVGGWVRVHGHYFFFKREQLHGLPRRPKIRLGRQADWLVEPTSRR